MRRKPLPGKKIFGAVLTVAAVSAGLFGCRPPVEYITETTAEEKTSGANDEGEIMIVTKEEDPQEKMAFQHQSHSKNRCLPPDR